MISDGVAGLSLVFTLWKFPFSAYQGLLRMWLNIVSEESPLFVTHVLFFLRGEDTMERDMCDGMDWNFVCEKRFIGMKIKDSSLEKEHFPCQGIWDVLYC